MKGGTTYLVHELTVHVADSIVMRCVFRSTEDNLVTKVDWTFSSGERAKVEAVLRYHPKLTTPGEYSRSWGRFQNRVNLTGDISRHDGSIVLREVKASDGGSYTCSVHLGDLVFRKTVVLSVIREETLVVPATVRPELLGGNQLLILVGIVCATILLLPVLILIVKRTHGSKRVRQRGRKRQRKRSSFHWLTPQMAAMAGATPI